MVWRSFTPIGSRSTTANPDGIFACNGILFNHESSRRGETFVTRKITRGMCYVSQGLEDCIFLGNLDALRDWGHARDYVRAQWLMLQQDEPRDFVIATGHQYSVRQFAIWAAEELGVTLRFEGGGVDEVGIVDSVSGAIETHFKPGDVIVRVDPRYFRPAEVESLVGDASAAREMLGWKPETTAREMCAEMMVTDLDAARRHALLLAHGYNPNAAKEN